MSNRKKIFSIILAVAANIGLYAVEKMPISESELSSKLPKIAFSQNEGPITADNHEWLANPKSGFKCFMPRIEEELEALYEMHIHHSFYDNPTEIWSRITDNMLSEFTWRLMDGLRAPTEEYLGWFKDFIFLADNFYDSDCKEKKEFISPLYIAKYHNVVDELYSIICYVTRGDSITNKKLGIEIIEAIATIFNNSKNFPKADFLGYYERSAKRVAQSKLK